MSDVLDKYFVANTEGVNSKGYRVLTSGIRTERFEQNPICLGEHSAWRVVGKWGDIKKEGNTLKVGKLKISRNQEEYKNDIEDGIISAVSMGLRPISWSEDPLLMMPGQTRPTLTECELVEVSLVAIPANPESVGVRLYAESETLEQLSMEQVERIFKHNETSETMSGTKNGTVEQTGTTQNGTMEQDGMERLGVIEGQVKQQNETLASLKTTLETLSKAVLSQNGTASGTMEQQNGTASGTASETSSGTASGTELERLKQEMEQLKQERLSVSEILKGFKGGATSETQDTQDFRKQDPAQLRKLMNDEPDKLEAMADEYLKFCFGV